MLDSLAGMFCWEEVLGWSWVQGWALRAGSSQEGAGKGDKDRELHPGDGQGRREPGQGWELQLHRVGSVGGGFSTNRKFIKSKQAKYEFRGTQRIHGFGSNSANIFSQKREGSKPPFLK